MNRWFCPRCGNGKLVPAQVALDDTRRVCLSCTATSPRLVLRVRARNVEEARRIAEETRTRQTRLRENARERRHADEVLVHTRGRCQHMAHHNIYTRCRKWSDHKGPHRHIKPAQDK